MLNKQAFQLNVNHPRANRYIVIEIEQVRGGGAGRAGARAGAGGPYV